jgi:uncharacterized protein
MKNEPSTTRKFGQAVVAGLAGLAVLGALSVSPSAAADNDKKPINYRVTGSTARGYFKAVSEAIDGIVRDAYPGSVANFRPATPAGGIKAISEGTADLIFTGAAPEVAYALEGKAPYTESYKGKFKFVMLLHTNLVAHNLMTEAWAKKNGITSFEDIANKKPEMRLGINQPATLTATVGEFQAIFDAYGLKESDVTKKGDVFRGNTAANLVALRDGKIDVMINGTFLPTALVADVARNRPLLWISASHKKMQEAADRWGNSTYTVPKGVYPFVTKDENTIAVWNAVLAGSNVPEETVYKFMKALFNNVDRVRSIHPSLKQFSLKNASRNPTKLELHPGAAHFYREAGIIK